MDKEKIDVNREHWDCRAEFHISQSKSSPSPAAYKIDKFLAGQNTLRPAELETIGEVKGRSLLHLQCHIGLDTLSWARLGAKVTGVDFSEKSVSCARDIATQTSLNACFIESDIYNLPQHLDELFDIVYTSRGVLMWLPDLSKWAEIVARFLKPGGLFYIHEESPISNCFEIENSNGNSCLVAKRSYFENTATAYESGTYTDRQAVFKHPKNFQWQHKLSDIITCLAKAGLVIEEMREFQEGFFQRYPQMERSEEGSWVLPSQLALLPLAFSIKAHKKS